VGIRLSAMPLPAPVTRGPGRRAKEGVRLPDHELLAACSTEVRHRRRGGATLPLAKTLSGDLEAPDQDVE
jgi:hypothetical protein